MKKFVMGVVVGGMLSLTSFVAASDSIEAFFFPAYFTINGQYTDVDNDYTVLNYKDHAYVPVRFIAEQLGAFVDFNDNHKEIIINHFPSSMNMLTDSKYPNVHFGLIDVYLDGGYTGVRGLLSVDNLQDSSIKKEHDIEFSLTFHDANDKPIGTALGSSKSASSLDKQTISTGEIKKVGAGEVGNFTKYSKVTFQITKYK